MKNVHLSAFATMLLTLPAVALLLGCAGGETGSPDPTLLNNPGGTRAVVDKGDLEGSVSAEGVDTLIIYGSRGPFRIHGMDPVGERFPETEAVAQATELRMDGIKPGEIAWRGTKEVSANAFMRGGNPGKSLDRARKAVKRGLDRTRLVHRRQGNTIEFRLEAPEENQSSFGEVSLVSVDLDFLVPTNLKLLMETEHGLAEVENIRGDVTIVQRGPAVKVRDVEGNVKVDAAYGPVVTGRIKGNVNIRCRIGNVITQDIDGNVVATADRGDIIHLSTSPPTHSSSYLTHNGNIEAYYPATSSMVVSASAARGPVNVNLPGLRSTTREDSEVSGTLGAGGPKMVFRASRGTIAIKTERQFPEFVERDMTDEEFERAMRDFEQQKREGTDPGWGKEGRDITFN